MIKVYIERGIYAEDIATVRDEWVYMALLPALEKLAVDWGGILTESVVDDTDKPCIHEKIYLLMSATKHHNQDGIVMKVFLNEDKAKAHMEELEIYDKVTDSEMYDYWIKEHNIEL
jgi:hypothetical protein